MWGAYILMSRKRNDESNSCGQGFTKEQNFLSWKRSYCRISIWSMAACWLPLSKFRMRRTTSAQRVHNWDPCHLTRRDLPAPYIRNIHHNRRQTTPYYDFCDWRTFSTAHLCFLYIIGDLAGTDQSVSGSIAESRYPPGHPLFVYLRTVKHDGLDLCGYESEWTDRGLSL